MQFPLTEGSKNVNSILRQPYECEYGLECPDKVTLLFFKIDCWSHY